MFEKRPTDIQKIGKALMIGLFIAVPLLMFAPRFFATADLTLQSRDRQTRNHERRQKELQRGVDIPLPYEPPVVQVINQ